jgi:hypothetical protein
MQGGRQDLYRQPEPVKSKLFPGALGFTIVILLVCVAAQRSPAPIVETPENPTPPPVEQSSPQKWKRSVKAKSETAATSKEPRQKPATTGPARFAGTWSGTISQGILGHIKVSLSINAEGTIVRISSSDRPATVNGNTITWRSGWLNEITWTLTPEKGGTTALVTSNSALGVNGTATFTRTQSPVVSSAPNQPAATPPPSNPPANIPTAKQVPGRPGFVYNPYDPKPDAIFDVRGQTHGATVRDPASGKLFVIP